MPQLLSCFAVGGQVIHAGTVERRWASVLTRVWQLCRRASSHTLRTSAAPVVRGMTGFDLTEASTLM